MGMPIEDFDGKLFKTASSNFSKFLMGISVYHLPFKG